MLKKSFPILLFVIACLFILIATPAFADISGGVDSPEDPIAMLALLACGAIGMPALRERVHRKQNK